MHPSQQNLWRKLFLDVLRHVDGLATTTLIGVDYELRRWERWLASRNLHWLSVSPDDLQAWLACILEGHPASATANRRTWVLRRLYKWAQQEHLLVVNPWDRIARPRWQHQWSPRYIPSKSAVLRLLAQPDTATFRGMRDRAILELLYASGLRTSELLGLQYQQVRCGVANRVIRIMGKGGKERLVIYGEHALRWLRSYEQFARPALLQAGRSGKGWSHAYFVHDSPGGAMSYKVLNTAIRRYADAADMPLLTAHSLRHACATHLYQGGANLRVIQMLLGHSLLETTAVYVHTDMEQLRALVERHHPRGALYVPFSRGENERRSRRH